jgi:glucokinase
MSNVLLADIGATNCRFAVCGEDGRPDHVMKLRGDVVASLEAAIARYLDETGARPRAAVLAIAAPIDGDGVAMTNRAWSFRFSELALRFGWTAVRGINDFEAVACGVRRLTADDVRPLGPPMPVGDGTRVVFGPGTGLGVAALVPSGARWQVVATEGGHVSFGPARDDEEAIFARLRVQCGAVSAETILCGPGLERLYRAMHGDAATPSSAEIVGRAHEGNGAARDCVMLFARLFGRFAGDLALMFKALGGVYVGGGVARRIGALLDDATFREAFEDHPPYAHLLRRIPTILITLDEPGLLGCAAVAEEMMAGKG